MKIAIYFSHSGHTKKVAEYIAGKLNCETIRLEEEKKRRGLVHFFVGGFKAVRGLEEKLLPFKDIGPYAEIFLGLPVWAGKTCPAVNFFINHAPLEGKKVHVFFTLGGDDWQKAGEQIRSMLSAKGALPGAVSAFPNFREFNETCVRTADDFINTVSKG